MPQMDMWEWLLLGVAAYLAWTGIVTLMRGRRDALVDELSWQAEMERRRQSLARLKEQRRELMEKLNRQAS